MIATQYLIYDGNGLRGKWEEAICVGVEEDLDRAIWAARDANGCVCRLDAETGKILVVWPMDGEQR